MLENDRRSAGKLLRDNIGQLIATRRDKQKDLAQWCGHSEAWISAFLRGEREFRMKDLDRIADFFGVATYQLIQPGISRLTERRSGLERRASRDRRIGHAQRAVGELATDLNRVRSPRSPGHEEDRRSPQLPAPIPALIRQLAQHLDRLSPSQPRRQAPRARTSKSKGRVRDRGDRGSAAPKTDG